MKVYLTGYFDKNLGDDLLQLLLIKALPQHEFYVYHTQREMLAHLENLPNVHITKELPLVDAHVHVIGTGFLYNGKRAILEKCLELFTAKPVSYLKNALIGSSMENIKGFLSAFFTKRELKRFKLITCRDEASFDSIKKLCPKARLEKHQDMVFSLPESLIFPLTEEGCLGVSVSGRMYSDRNFSIYKKIAIVCDTFITQYGKKVLLFAFDSGMENDASAALSVQKIMKNKEKTEIIVYNSEPDVFLKQFARCGRFLGTRFHSVVLALLYKIPVVGLSDALKMKRLCATYSVPYFSMEKLEEKTLSSLLQSDLKSVILPTDSCKDAKQHITALTTYLEEKK